MIEKFKEAVDSGDKFGEVLTYLTKVFACRDQKLFFVGFCRCLLSSYYPIYKIAFNVSK